MEKSFHKPPIKHSQWAKSRKKKQSEGVRFFRHSKYSAILSKYPPIDCLFGDFAHWKEITVFKKNIKKPQYAQRKKWCFFIFFWCRIYI